MFTIFLFNRKKTFGPCEKGYYFCLDKVDLHWVALKYVDSYVMQVDLDRNMGGRSPSIIPDLEVDLFE